MNTEREALLPFLCRHGRHAFRRVREKGDLLSSNRMARHTWFTVEKCHRCGLERQIEHFDSDGYWREVEREIEDRRLEEVIRRARR